VRLALNGSVADSGYELGDLVKVTVVIQRKEDTLWVAPQAIRTFEGRQFVVLQDGNAQRRVDVKLGILGEDQIEILSGLTEGQVVVSP
jgi:multidrug efflux pump subunit AcrA (membrane-fusion protein)